MKERMMKTWNILILTSMLLLVFAMASCNLFFGTSIEERIDEFNSDVAAGNWDILYIHFHPDTQDRVEMKNIPVDDPANPDDEDGYWPNAPFWSGDEIQSYTVSGDTASGIMSSGNTVSIEMKQDGWDYKILTMTISTGSVDFNIRSFQ